MLSDALRQGDWARAETLLRPLAEAPGAPVAARFNLGKVLMEQGDFARAAAWLRRACDQAPDHAGAWFEQGRALLAQGDLAPAQAAFARALDLDGTDADARRNLGRIALRRGDWAAAARGFEGAGDDEALIARYRIACETGQDARPLRDALLARPDLRPQVIKAMVRVAHGAVPLHLPPLAEDQAR